MSKYSNVKALKKRYHKDNKRFNADYSVIKNVSREVVMNIEILKELVSDLDVCIRNEINPGRLIEIQKKLIILIETHQKCCGNCDDKSKKEIET